MTSASPSPKSPEVSEKTKKYDRQLRLWGDHGQNKLEKSRICLINANATGTEILKSLVLPGCGHFVIVDGNRVSQEDIGNNFFLENESLGKSRAECTLRLLLELNTDVSGEAIEVHPDSLLNTDTNFFDQFTIVIGCQLSERVLSALSKTLWEKQIPFISVQSVGFIGWIRVQLNEHAIIESHPDNQKLDLRLDTPFPELETYMGSIQLEGHGREDVLKTPWLVLLYKALKSYLQESQNGSSENGCSQSRFPLTSKQKMEFKRYLKQYLDKFELNENDDVYEEAVKAVNTAVMRTTTPDEVRTILDDPKVSKLESKFWVLCAALKEFINERNGQLPVKGVLPDMTADSEKYISLQNVYREKASKDSNEILDKVCRIRQSGRPNLNITAEEVRLFCKESYNLRLIRGYPVYEELESTPNSVLTELAQNMEETDLELMFYIILRGYLRFQNDYNSYPGASDAESDTARFKATVTKLLNEWNTSVIPSEDCIHEICRYGGAELPSIAAFVGGCAAHEAIKIITSQYIPLDNTFIYNGITSTTRSLKIVADT